MDDIRYVFAVLVLAFVPFAVVWWCLVHPFVGFWRRVGATKTLLVMGLGMALTVTAVIKFRDRLVLTDYGTHGPLLVVAVVLFVAAAWIGIRRSRFLTMDILVGLPELEAGGHGGRLLTEGIYGRIRHPRYVEIAVGTLAYAIFSNYLGAYLAALVFVPALHLVVLLEERELRDRFGEAYENYSERVPRYVPRLFSAR